VTDILVTKGGTQDVDNATFTTYRVNNVTVCSAAPVENLAYTGTNWIQPGDILDLQVYCNGSGSFQYCAYPETQDYNVTGK